MEVFFLIIVVIIIFKLFSIARSDGNIDLHKQRNKLMDNNALGTPSNDLVENTDHHHHHHNHHSDHSHHGHHHSDTSSWGGDSGSHHS